MMYKDAYRHTFLGNQLASGPQLGTGDHVSVGPDLGGMQRCVEVRRRRYVLPHSSPGFGEVLRTSLGCKLLMRQLA